MIDMVGLGPFIVTPFVIAQMHGPQSIFAWLLGALLAFADGCIWSELGAAMPMAGGSYVFLRELFGAKKLGGLMAFLFIWQTTIQAPLVIASGAIGFSQYFNYLVPLNDYAAKAISGGVVILLIIILYRKITSIGKISVMLWIGVIATLAWIIFSGFTHFHPALILDNLEPFNFNTLFFAGLGNATIKTVYAYLGYYNVCHLGGEIENPEKNIPKSIFLSITGIALIYILMQISILGVLPWQDAASSKAVISTFIEKIYGSTAANITTILILWVGFASLFSAMLGYSRIPYAAAADGKFFPIFAKLHPTKNFPHVSLLILGGIAFVFSLLFKLSEVISAIIVMRILVQFVGQAIGLMLLHKREPNRKFPYRMWIYPIPAIVSIAVWLFLFFSADIKFILGAIGVIVLGIIIFMLRAKKNKEWPFEEKPIINQITSNYSKTG